MESYLIKQLPGTKIKPQAHNLIILFDWTIGLLETFDISTFSIDIYFMFSSRLNFTPRVDAVMVNNTNIQA